MVNRKDTPRIVDSLNEKSDMIANAVNCMDVIRYPELLPLAEVMIEFMNEKCDGGEMWSDFMNKGGIE